MPETVSETPKSQTWWGAISSFFSKPTGSHIGLGSYNSEKCSIDVSVAVERRRESSLQPDSHSNPDSKPEVVNSTGIVEASNTVHSSTPDSSIDISDGYVHIEHNADLLASGTYTNDLFSGVFSSTIDNIDRQIAAFSQQDAGHFSSGFPEHISSAYPMEISSPNSSSAWDDLDAFLMADVRNSSRLEEIDEFTTGGLKVLHHIHPSLWRLTRYRDDGSWAADAEETMRLIIQSSELREQSRILPYIWRQLYGETGPKALDVHVSRKKMIFKYQSFHRNATSAFRKLVLRSNDPYNIPSQELKNFVLGLENTEYVVDLGLSTLLKFFNRELPKSLKDIYCMLHVTYAMSLCPLETRDSPPMTDSKFSEALADCKDSLLVVSNAGAQEKSLFEELKDIMWPTGKYSASCSIPDPVILLSKNIDGRDGKYIKHETENLKWELALSPDSWESPQPSEISSIFDPQFYQDETDSLHYGIPQLHDSLSEHVAWESFDSSPIIYAAQQFYKEIRETGICFLYICATASGSLYHAMRNDVKGESGIKLDRQTRQIAVETLYSKLVFGMDVAVDIQLCATGVIWALNTPFLDGTIRSLYDLEKSTIGLLKIYPLRPASLEELISRIHMQFKDFNWELSTLRATPDIMGVPSDYGSPQLEIEATPSVLSILSNAAVQSAGQTDNLNSPLDLSRKRRQSQSISDEIEEKYIQSPKKAKLPSVAIIQEGRNACGCSRQPKNKQSQHTLEFASAHLTSNRKIQPALTHRIQNLGFAGAHLGPNGSKQQDSSSQNQIDPSFNFYQGPKHKPRHGFSHTLPSTL